MVIPLFISINDNVEYIGFRFYYIGSDLALTQRHVMTGEITIRKLSIIGCNYYCVKYNNFTIALNVQKIIDFKNLLLLLIIFELLILSDF